MPRREAPEWVHELERCLDKDPTQRLRDIGDGRIELSRLLDAGTSTLVVEAPAAPTSERPWTGLWIAGALGFALGAAMIWAIGRQPEEMAVRSQGGKRMLTISTVGRDLVDVQAISPDGRWVVFTAEEKLWIRAIDELESREIPETEGATAPFWKPDSVGIGFAAGR